MDEHPITEKEDYGAKVKETEHLANPITRKVYFGARGDAGDDADDFMDDEL
jgi:hypothetical protein